MMQRTQQTYHHAGFSLFELAAVLAIIGVVVGMSLSAGTMQLRMAESQGTRNNLEVVRTALDLYQAKHGRYPCPASLTIATTDPTYGIEVNTCGPSDTLTGLNGNAVAAIGAVPFRTIGLNDEAALDKWDSRIIYALDRAHASSSQGNGGRLRVLDAQNRDVANSPALGRAIYVLASTGANKYGSFRENGTTALPTEWLSCIPTAPMPARNTMDAQNCDLADEIFRDMPKNQGAAGNAVFDDEILWKTQDWGSSSINAGQSTSSSPPGFIPSTAPAPKANATSRLGAGALASCAINHSRVPYCWGANATGRVGDNTTITPRNGSVVKNNNSDWVSISTHFLISCGVRANGLGYCWGNGGSGQLGNGTTGAYSIPQLVSEDIAPPIPPLITDWVHIAASSTPCGVRADGQIYCWGTGITGQLGNGTTAGSADLPIPIDGPTGPGDRFFDWASVDTWNHACGVRAGGRGYCWGTANANGQLGNGSIAATFTRPTQVSNITNWKKINVGTNHSCGVTQGGRGYCWGTNLQGQLGDGTLVNKSVPQEVLGTHTNWSMIDGGQQFSCGLRNGIAYCWGSTALERLGLPTVPAYCTASVCREPMEVSGGITDWVTLSTGAGHTCGLRSDDSIWCWGSGSDRELGNGGAGNASSPVEAITYTP